MTHPGIQRDLLNLEKQEGSINFKIGVIYARGGQGREREREREAKLSQHYALSLLLRCTFPNEKV